MAVAACYSSDEQESWSEQGVSPHHLPEVHPPWFLQESSTFLGARFLLAALENDCWLMVPDPVIAHAS